MADLVTFGEVMLRLSPPGEQRLETAREYDVRVGGAEANAAVAAERLGADPVWLSKLPDSPLGHRAADELHGYGIETDVVWTDEGRQGLYFLEHGGAPRGTRAIYDRADSAVSSATVDELATDHLADARAFYVSGITPALSNTLADTTANMLSQARQAGTKTALDVNYRSKLWSPDQARAMLTKLFPAVDVLVTAARDARTLLDQEGDSRSIAHSLASKWEFDTVIVTRGDQGAVALHDGVVHEQEAYETDTVDAVGSGDAFAGAYVARRLAGDGVGEALAEGAAAAALKRTIPGDAATITREEVREVVESADEDEDAISR
jgi:2-dehydro-3-deoxygluconokinase